MEALDRMQKTVPEQTLIATENLKKTLMAGITTVRDVGSIDFIDVGLRNAVRAGVIPGPRMLVSVHAIGATGGHCDFQGGFRFGLFAHETGRKMASSMEPNKRRSGPAERQVWRGYHQDLRHRRRAIADRRCRHAAAHAGRAERDRG